MALNKRLTVALTESSVDWAKLWQAAIKNRLKNIVLIYVEKFEFGKDFGQDRKTKFMKTSIRALGIFLIVLTTLISTSCSKRSHSSTSVIITNKPNSLPPGQAKKVYGQQSAKEFAPGQQKKKGGSTTVVVKN
jgi:hypothetical protein